MTVKTTHTIDTSFFNLFYWEANNAMYNVTYLTKMYAKAKLTGEEKMSLGLNLNILNPGEEQKKTQKFTMIAIKNLSLQSLCPYII